MNVWNRRIDKLREDQTLHPADLRIGNVGLFQTWKDGEIIAAYNKWNVEFKGVDQCIIDMLHGKLCSFSYEILLFLIVTLF